jgi:Capsule polysaccharide biosynthesis protein
MSLRERLSPVGNMHARGDRSRVDRFVARLRRVPDRIYLARAGALPALEALGASVAEAAPPATGPRVLFLSLRYMPDHVAYETLMAQALRMRGAEVTVLTCGGGMPICEIGWAGRAAPRPCDRCGFHTDRTGAAARLGHQRLADTLPWGDDARNAPTGVVPDPHALELAAISIPWFMRASDPSPFPESQAATEAFQVSVQGVAAASERILDETHPDVVVMLNGLFAAESVVREAALKRDIRVVTYEIAPRGGHLVFSQDRPAPEYDTTALWEQVRDQPLTRAQDEALDAELRGRISGDTAHERYFDAPRESLAELDIPQGSRIISLFTNLSWDSACIGHDVAYPSMLDWVAGAVTAMKDLDDTVLVIRIHPAEDKWGTRERVADGLRDRVGELPGNVRFVGPNQPLSSYAVAQASDLVLTYTTTVGLEAAARGVPVAVAGDTHYRDRGFTHDLTNHDDLVQAMRSVRAPLDEEQQELARRYAFTFFFRLMVPLPPVQTAAGVVASMAQTATEIAPGADPYVDWVSDRILDGKPFPLPDELAIHAGAGGDLR